MSVVGHSREVSGAGGDGESRGSTYEELLALPGGIAAVFLERRGLEGSKARCCRGLLPTR